MGFDISDFKLQRLVVEIRYEPAFLLWDKAGSVGVELRNRFPATKVRIVQPNQQQFSLDKKFAAGVQFDRTFLQGVYPAHNLEDIRTTSEAFFPIVIGALKISDLSRIGLLGVYEKRFESRELASEFVKCQPSLRRGGKFFNVDGAKILDPEFFLRWKATRWAVPLSYIRLSSVLKSRFQRSWMTFNLLIQKEMWRCWKLTTTLTAAPPFPNSMRQL